MRVPSSVVPSEWQQMVLSAFGPPVLTASAHIILEHVLLYREHTASRYLNVADAAYLSSALHMT